MFCKFFDKKVKNLSCCDIALTKIGVFLFTLGIVSGWQLFQNLILGISWYWFIGAAIIFAIIPMKHFFKK